MAALAGTSRVDAQELYLGHDFAGQATYDVIGVGVVVQVQLPVRQRSAVGRVARQAGSPPVESEPEGLGVAVPLPCRDGHVGAAPTASGPCTASEAQ